MAFYFGGYLITLDTLKTLAMARNGQLPRVAEGYDPYLADIKQALEKLPNFLGLGFDDLLRDVRGVALPKKLPDEKTEGGIILVRVEGDPLERPDMFRETDKRVKQVLEERLGVEIGPFLSYSI
jgi:hypothetical protein